MTPIIQAIFFDLGDTLVGSNRTFLPNAKAVLSQLRSKSIRLGIISNTGQFTRDQLSAQLLPRDFDWTVFEPALVILSSEVGVEKPKPAIFKKAVTKSGLAADKCLYCSENQIEILAAQLAGLRTVRLQRPPQSDLGELVQQLVAAKYL